MAEDEKDEEGDGVADILGRRAAGVARWDG
jgi:hypothetical protein